jgi:cysteine desulfurase/selenocysteine lyase
MPSAFDVAQFRAQFPIFTKSFGVYLDTGATSLTPQVVSDAICKYYCQERATVGRSAYRSAIKAANQVAKAREDLSRHINLPPGHVLVFCQGATAALNLLPLAYPWQPGDNVVITLLEHNANLLPWMNLRGKGVELRIAQPEPDGNINAKAITDMFDKNTRFVSFTHVSNVLGTSPPVEEVCAAARRRGIYSVIDGAQSFGHMPVDLAELGCDAFAASAHKAFGPTGIGFLTLSDRLQERVTSPILGGGMVESVDLNGFVAKAPPAGWEPGTPNISGIIAWGESLSVLKQAISPAAMDYVGGLLQEMHDGLSAILGVSIFGPAKPPRHSSVVSFTLDGMGAHRVGSSLDELFGVMVRAGHHCAMLVHRVMLRQLRGTVRASLAPYNTHDEVRALLNAVTNLQGVIK